MLNILNSDWLIKMIQKSGKKPDLRILNAFDILSDWIAAPSIAQHIQSDELEKIHPQKLLRYLSEESHAAGAINPDTLAQQVVFLMLSGLRDELRKPESKALYHAKCATKALIKAQREKENPLIKIKRPAIYMSLGILFGVALIGALIASHNETTIQAIVQIQASTANENITEQDMPANPKATADLFATYETMRSGDCQYIEALQIPEADKKVYLENVVAGNVPTNAQDQLIAQKYIQKIRCNYSPMLMKNSIN